MFEFIPIGYVRNDRPELYQVPFQTGLMGDFQAVIELKPESHFEEALKDLDGFERVWIIFAFHKAKNWKPKIFPPRGAEKRGLFATRSPHRPNPIGMSAVKLTKIEGLKIFIEDHDLVDGTPVLDIKPYLPYVDSFPHVSYGWLEEEALPSAYGLEFSKVFTKKIQWLKENVALDLVPFIDVNLKLHPFPRKGNRIEKLSDERYKMAVKTWRVLYRVQGREVILDDLFSGYEREYIDGSKQSKWDDIEIHRNFLSVFGQK